MYLFQALPCTSKSTGMCQVPCSGTVVFAVTLQIRDPGFQVVIACQDHVLAPSRSWHRVCTLSHPRVMEVSSLSLVSYKCARKLWADVLASWWLKWDTTKTFLLLCLVMLAHPSSSAHFPFTWVWGFLKVFYRYRQFLPVTIQTWVRAVEVKTKIHLKLSSWAKMFFQEYK